MKIIVSAAFLHIRSLLAGVITLKRYSRLGGTHLRHAVKLN